MAKTILSQNEVDKCHRIDNVFMSSLEENLEREGRLPSFYRRYVDNTALTIMPNTETASNFLDTLKRHIPP